MLRTQERGRAKRWRAASEEEKRWCPGHLEPEDELLMLREEWVRTGTDAGPVENSSLMAHIFFSRRDQWLFWWRDVVGYLIKDYETQCPFVETNQAASRLPWKERGLTHLNVLSLSELWKVKIQPSQQELLWWLLLAGQRIPFLMGKNWKRCLQSGQTHYHCLWLWERLACPGEFHGYISLVWIPDVLVFQNGWSRAWLTRRDLRHSKLRSGLERMMGLWREEEGLEGREDGSGTRRKWQWGTAWGMVPPASGDTKKPAPSVPGKVFLHPSLICLYLGLSVSPLIPHHLSTSEFPEVSGDLKFNNWHESQ